jgi:hypothetical protein
MDGESTDGPAAGSGGGGHGRLRINTPTATFSGESNAVIRGVLTAGMTSVQ